jgi:hypothetical protein
MMTEESRSTCRKVYHSANFSTTELSRIGQESNQTLQDERPATNSLSHDTANIKSKVKKKQYGRTCM